MSIRIFDNKQPTLGKRVFVDESAVVIGEVTLADDVSIWPHASVRGDVHSISIGKSTNIQDGSVLHVSHDSEYTPGGFKLSIGEGVTVGHRAILHGCEIGHYCLVGMGAIVMDGATLADKVLLGAGSLVMQNMQLQGEYLWAGSPVRKIRPLTEPELEYLEYSAQHYVRLKDKYL